MNINLIPHLFAAHMTVLRRSVIHSILIFYLLNDGTGHILSI